jgi:hypothetical protein
VHDTRNSTKALGWAFERRWRRAARRGGRRPTANGGERGRRGTGHENLNERHRGAPHLAAKLRGGSKTTARRRRSGLTTATDGGAVRVSEAAAAPQSRVLGRWRQRRRVGHA